MPENARKNEFGEIVKMANKAAQSLVGILTFLPTSPATNKSMQMTSGPPLQVPNMANLTNAVTLVDVVN